MNLNVILTVSVLVAGFFVLTELALVLLWGLAKLQKRPMDKWLIAVVWVAALPVYLCLFQLLGLMVNFTPSLPVGIYRQASNQTISRGDIVSYCLDVPGFIALAKERDYLGNGCCNTGLKPLLKYVAGMPGDTVDITVNSQITINQEPLPHVYVAQTDSQGRAIPKTYLFTGIILEDKAYLVSYHMGGFDSRYFGLVDIGKLKKFKPLITF